jgi:hypothetical protein
MSTTLPACIAVEPTSNACSNRFVNEFSTILCCSLPGTYALPAFTYTFLPSTKSGTRIQSTLHQSSSSTCCARLP